MQSLRNRDFQDHAGAHSILDLGPPGFFLIGLEFFVLNPMLVSNPFPARHGKHSCNRISTAEDHGQRACAFRLWSIKGRGMESPLRHLLCLFRIRLCRNNRLCCAIQTFLHFLQRILYIVPAALQLLMPEPNLKPLS